MNEKIYASQDWVLENVKGGSSDITEPQEWTDEQRAQARKNISEYDWRTCTDSYGTYTYAINHNLNKINYDVAQSVVNVTGNGSVSALDDMISWLWASSLRGDGYSTIAPTNTIKNAVLNYNALKNGGAITNSSLYIFFPDYAKKSSILLNKGLVTVLICDYTSKTASNHNSTHGVFCYGQEIDQEYWYDADTNTVIYFKNTYHGVDDTLTYAGKSADAKAVGDALVGLASEEFVKNKIAEAELSGEEIDLSGYVQKSELPTKLSQLENDKNYLTSVPSEYITETELNNKGYLTEHQSLTDYAKKNEIPTMLSDLSEDTTHRVVTDAEKSNWNAKSNFSGAYADLTGKPTIPIVPTKVSEFENDAKYLTSIPNNYVTETELNSKGYLTEHQDLSGYAELTDLPTKLADLLGDATHRVVTDTEKTAWNNKAEVSAIPTKVSQLTNDSQYLTSVPDGYAKTEDIPQIPADIGAQPAGEYALKSEVTTMNNAIAQKSQVQFITWEADD